MHYKYDEEYNVRLFYLALSRKANSHFHSNTNIVIRRTSIEAKLLEAVGLGSNLGEDNHLLNSF